MISFLLRMFGMDIPEGPIVFVDNTSVLPTTIYDVDYDDCLQRNNDERIMVDVREEDRKINFRGKNKNLDGLILSQSV